jgi:hypothetical protein
LKLVLAGVFIYFIYLWHRLLIDHIFQRKITNIPFACEEYVYIVSVYHCSPFPSDYVILYHLLQLNQLAARQPPMALNIREAKQKQNLVSPVKAGRVRRHTSTAIHRRHSPTRISRRLSTFVGIQANLPCPGATRQTPRKNGNIAMCRYVHRNQQVSETMRGVLNIEIISNNYF